MPLLRLIMLEGIVPSNTIPFIWGPKVKPRSRDHCCFFGRRIAESETSGVESVPWSLFPGASCELRRCLRAHYDYEVVLNVGNEGC